MYPTSHFIDEKIRRLVPLPKVIALIRAQLALIASAFFPVSHTASPFEERLPLASVPVINCICPQLLSGPLTP